MDNVRTFLWEFEDAAAKMLNSYNAPDYQLHLRERLLKISLETTLLSIAVSLALLILWLYDSNFLQSESAFILFVRVIVIVSSVSHAIKTCVFMFMIIFHEVMMTVMMFGLMFINLTRVFNWGKTWVVRNTSFSSGAVLNPWNDFLRWVTNTQLFAFAVLSILRSSSSSLNDEQRSKVFHAVSSEKIFLLCIWQTINISFKSSKKLRWKAFLMISTRLWRFLLILICSPICSKPKSFSDEKQQAFIPNIKFYLLSMVVDVTSSWDWKILAHFFTAVTR